MHTKLDLIVSPGTKKITLIFSIVYISKKHLLNVLFVIDFKLNNHSANVTNYLPILKRTHLTSTFRWMSISQTV